MIDALETMAEQQAIKAEELPAFSGIKLLHVKRQVAELLALIGKNGIFDEYTVHNIDHIDQMLKSLEWLIPSRTQRIMSSADWLMAILAIYFHDLGMLVTKREYDARSMSGFIRFRDDILFDGRDGADYRAKVNILGADNAERFFYQEFVRHKHAERIKSWIMGKSSDHLGISHEAVQQIDELLQPLGEQFRRDLAFICESHHLDDLNNFKKYKISQPYGNSDQETANLHFASILLRTADLLHITSDRTPTVMFRTINPTDPISQEEWAKQMAVRRVRPKTKQDKEGHLDESIAKDTVEIHAFFKKEDGFFGLTSYLTYVTEQLRKTSEWVLDAMRSQGSQHEFPWRDIDDSNIETIGFLRDTFEFTFDQARILDLLTGHTLYNDTQVVIRELVQNSLDAIRLQKHVDSNSTPGKISIRWSNADRVLIIEDNGTGMTQEIINKHLLTVGSSRYQDEEFKKKYPDFSAISRFGIGVLSTFMVADMVTITTCHPEEEDARQLSLRSVHGKYLIRLLNKREDSEARSLGEHGTRITLTIRHSANLADVVQTAQKWILIPGCDVSVTQDDQPAVSIGYTSPEEALKESLKKLGYDVDDNGTAPKANLVRVHQSEQGGVVLAYALSWSAWFQEWGFLTRSRYRTQRAQMPVPELGTCIEGIRVEFTPPGFPNGSIIALSNVSGDKGLKTNVARSGLEVTSERESMLQAIYAMYCKHVSSEIADLNLKRSFSLTWATQEAGYLVAPLFETPASDMKLLIDALSEFPLLLVEQEGQRVATSVNSIKKHEAFWTIDCAFFRSAEELFRELKSDASLSGLVGGLGSKDIVLPEQPVLCGSNFQRVPEILAFREREVDKVCLYKDQRRIDLRWVQRLDNPRWVVFDTLASGYREFTGDEFYLKTRGIQLTSADRLQIPMSDIELEGLEGEDAIVTFNTTFLVPNRPITTLLSSLVADHLSSPQLESLNNLWLHLVIAATAMESQVKLDPPRFISRILTEINESRVLERSISPEAFDELATVLKTTPWKTFDVSAWSRKQSEPDSF